MNSHTYTGQVVVGGWGDDLDRQDVMVTLFTEEPLPEDLGVTVALRSGSRWRQQVLLIKEDSG